ncbi:MAG: hypothetical protein AAGE05_08800 [Pseudomonadota bacterium]
MHPVSKSNTILALAFPALVALSACGGGPAPGPGEFAAACNAQNNLSEDICACLDEQAQGLSGESHAFVIATIAEDEVEAQRLRTDLDDNQALEAGQFISRGIQECIIDLPDTANG